MEKKKKYNIAVILTYIASVLTSLLAIISLVIIIPLDNYASFFSSLKADEIYGEMISLLVASGTDEAYISTILYIVFIILSIISLLLAVPSLVFALLNKNEKNLTNEEFQSHNKKHIWFLISIGLGYFSNTYNLVSSLVQEISLLNSAATILYVIAFFFALMTIIKNKKALKQNVQEVDNGNTIFDFENDNDNNENGNDNNNVFLDNHEVKADPKKLDKVYELLSKLEKEYKNGEIQEEDYIRMKETILNNYLDD